MSQNRRRFIVATAAAALAPRLVIAQTATPAAISGPFKIPPLPYPTNALEPHIDALTMEIHHDGHHGAYVSSLNTIAKDYPQIAAAAPAEVLAKLLELPEQIRTGVRNNLGGHVNHTMFWQIMSPTGGKASPELAAAIDRDLGGLEKLQSDLNANGLRVFGSGWTLVTVTRDGKLALETKSNQDFSIDGRQAGIVRQRRVGTCLLSPLPKPPRRLFESLVECCELECLERTLRRGEIRQLGNVVALDAVSSTGPIFMRPNLSTYVAGTDRSQHFGIRLPPR